MKKMNNATSISEKRTIREERPQDVCAAERSTTAVVPAGKKLKTLPVLPLLHSLCTESPTHMYSSFVCIQYQAGVL
jgi:hypothetical protein